MRFVALMLLLSVPSLAAYADIYRSVDAKGQITYSDTPTPGAELLRVTNPRTGAAPSEPAPKPVSSDAVRDKLANDDAKRTVQGDVASSRADECQKAQDQYQKSVQSRRIYKTGQSGEREYLSDSEADALRLNYKLAVDEACGKS